jgi:hypothetical protein
VLDSEHGNALPNFTDVVQLLDQLGMVLAFQHGVPSVELVSLVS